jgi:hypothetical protein
MLGLSFAGQTRHVIWKTYEKGLIGKLEKLNQGHHVGALHALGVTLGCRLLGPEAYVALTTMWLDKLIAKQKPDGGVYVGDDGAAGGESALLGGDYGSTAAFALLLLGQDADLLQRARPGVAKPGSTPQGRDRR